MTFEWREGGWGPFAWVWRREGIGASAMRGGGFFREGESEREVSVFFWAGVVKCSAKRGKEKERGREKKEEWSGVRLVGG